MLPDVCSSSSAIPGFRGWRPGYDVAIVDQQVFGDKLRVEFLETPLSSLQQSTVGTPIHTLDNSAYYTYSERFYIDRPCSISATYPIVLARLAYPAKC